MEDTPTINQNRPKAMDRLKKKEASRTKVLITMSSDIAEELEEAEAQLSMLQLQEMSGLEAVSDKVTEARARVDQARAAAREDGVEFVFRSIGRKAYDKIVTDHPPTDSNRKEAEAQGGDPKALQWNPYTFPQALVAAAIVHPKLSAEEIEEMWDSDDWSGRELEQLVFAAMAAQQKNRVVQMGNA